MMTQGHNQTIHRNPVKNHSQEPCEWFGHDLHSSGSVGKIGANIALESWKLTVQILALFGTGAVYPTHHKSCISFFEI